MGVASKPWHIIYISYIKGHVNQWMILNIIKFELLDNDHKVTRVCKPILCLFSSLLCSFCYVVVPCIFVIIIFFEYFNVWVINVLVFVINDEGCILMKNIEIW